MSQESESTAPFVARGITTLDPLMDLPMGAAFTMAPIIFGASDATVQPQAVKNWGFFDGAIMALGLKDRAGLDISGTAVMIAPGLAVTATHVLRSSIGRIGVGDEVPYCLGVRDHERLDIWRSTALSYDDGTSPSSPLSSTRRWMKIGNCAASRLRREPRTSAKD